MNQNKIFKLDLRNLILALAIFGVLITLSNAMYSIYHVQRDLLINKTMESNRVYAEKLAQTTDTFLDSAIHQLEFSAATISTIIDDDAALARETNRLQTQSEMFNSVVVVNSDAVITSISPADIPVKGIKMTSDDGLQSLRAQKPLVTEPFVSPAGNYLTSISYPIFDKNNRYRGFVAGSIYLNNKNIISALLGQHNYLDESYLYVVDRTKTLIFHPEHERIGEKVANNPAINSVLTGKTGTLDIVNSKGIEMLAGFAPIKNTGWGIVVQRPKQASLDELNNQMLKVFEHSLPVGVITLITIWIAAYLISRPLWQLAQSVKHMGGNYSVNNIFQIRSWYFEVAHLKDAIIASYGILNQKIDKLHNDSHTDPMTGLLNRRGLFSSIEVYEQNRQPLAIFAIDIDHFKQINDTFGHDLGDKVLVELAKLMQSLARKNDTICRSGGEEFLIFLEDITLSQALDIAERLRKQIHGHFIPRVGHVTASIGISHWPDNGASINDAIIKADKALYQAKANGRNRTEVHSQDIALSS
ncbi:sensor domain-containing diguanylate cyclase [Vibrio sp.]|uniref:sensor domain-containing diguanylate cyclase n=1 Tax=Vibrio sp. TaxID=678 RepID=UPI003D0E8244